MKEFIISLGWNRLDSITEFVDRQLIREGVPTILRLRAQLVLEECFSAAMAASGADTAQIRCSFPAPRTVLVQLLLCAQAAKTFHTICKKEKAFKRSF